MLKPEEGLYFIYKLKLNCDEKIINSLQVSVE